MTLLTTLRNEFKCR